VREQDFVGGCSVLSAMVSRREVSVAAAISALLLLTVAIVVGYASSGWSLSSRARSTEHARAPDRELLFQFADAQANLLPSVYLDYDNPTNELNTAWFSTFRVTASTESTFFVVQRTQFGYFGIQQDSTYFTGLARAMGMHFNGKVFDEYSGIVLFSIWDNADCERGYCASHERCRVEAIGENAWDESFGGEGTGCQIKLKVAWGKTQYSFVATVEDVGNDWLLFHGYWHDAEDSDPWIFIGSIKVKKNGRNLGNGGISSFIEQYRSMYPDEVRMAEFGPHFLETVSGQWVPITAATFTKTPNNVQGYCVGAVGRGGTLFDLGVAGTNALPGSTRDKTWLKLRSTPFPSQAPQLQSWLQLRRSGNLPTGCVGNSCGLFQKFQNFGRGLVPDGYEQVVMWIALLGFCVALAWVLCHCFGGRKPNGFTGPSLLR